MIMLRFFLLLSLLLNFVFSDAKSLYSDSDPLVQLDSTNFDKIVLGTSNAWIIEFYSSWCGHCIRFAPKWKQFSRNIKTWHRIVKVGVVNCNDAENLALCRKYEIEMFPTIKKFWRHTNATDVGELLKGKPELTVIENELVDFLESRWDKEVPSDWPDIRAVSTNSLANLTNFMPANKQSMMIFIEQPAVYTGRKVILDLSWQKDVLMKRILTTNERLMKDLNFKIAIDTVPAIIKLFKNNLQLPVIHFNFNDCTTKIRVEVFKLIIGTKRNETKIEDFFPAKTTPVPSSASAVYMTDLENAIYNLLHQEIAVVKNIKDEKLAAMKRIIYILKTYFPGSPPVTAYLSDLHEWVSDKSESIPGEDFSQLLELIQAETAYLPKRRKFIACRGSQPQFRGYPCSLWTLFHTLTVQADSETEPHGNPKEDPNEVLSGIRNYVKNFFSCRECSEHFTNMSANIQNEINNTRDAVLWLWQAHNKVNLRLAGDITEDPQNPKIQFPSISDCPMCRTKESDSGGIVWNRDEVHKYLHQFYGRQHIVPNRRFLDDIPNDLNNSPTELSFFARLIQLSLMLFGYTVGKYL